MVASGSCRGPTNCQVRRLGDLRGKARGHPYYDLGDSKAHASRAEKKELLGSHLKSLGEEEPGGVVSLLGWDGKLKGTPHVRGKVSKAL